MAMPQSPSWVSELLRLAETGVWAPTPPGPEQTTLSQSVWRLSYAAAISIPFFCLVPHIPAGKVSHFRTWVSVKGVLDLGINVLDTASAYLLSEERIGRAASERRSEYFLASKCGEYSNYEAQTTGYDFSYDAVSKSIDRSLRLLNVEQIDLVS
eukprot:SAG31_NODE_4987_length_2819_cov_1.180147_3_plen_154_part_00